MNEINEISLIHPDELGQVPLEVSRQVAQKKSTCCVSFGTGCQGGFGRWLRVCQVTSWGQDQLVVVSNLFDLNPGMLDPLATLW